MNLGDSAKMMSRFTHLYNEMVSIMGDGRKCMDQYARNYFWIRTLDRNWFSMTFFGVRFKTNDDSVAWLSIEYVWIKERHWEAFCVESMYSQVIQCILFP